ncbi:hypothetical protein ACRARG_12390 [Pseudooceanicola sp. C21-150M6]
MSASVSIIMVSREGNILPIAPEARAPRPCEHPAPAPVLLRKVLRSFGI